MVETNFRVKMKNRRQWIIHLFIMLFTMSVSVAIVPCGLVNIYGALGEVYSSVTIEAENEAQFYKVDVSKARKVKGINVYNVCFILYVTVLYIAFVVYSIRLPRENTIVTLKVRMDN